MATYAITANFSSTEIRPAPTQLTGPAKYKFIFSIDAGDIVIEETPIGTDTSHTFVYTPTAPYLNYKIACRTYLTSLTSPYELIVVDGCSINFEFPDSEGFYNLPTGLNVTFTVV
jgi:hypothetical protein